MSSFPERRSMDPTAAPDLPPSGPTFLTDGAASSLTARFIDAPISRNGGGGAPGCCLPAAAALFKDDGCRGEGCGVYCVNLSTATTALELSTEGGVGFSGELIGEE
ncbi:unnamed protein product [Linum trigynum]|uniref:Uncharacterized protein n=1 Tax=Linum trigynum TaxID=586398 RepID=A0AAV2G869_9ROSI